MKKLLLLVHILWLSAGVSLAKEGDEKPLDRKPLPHKSVGVKEVPLPTNLEAVALQTAEHKAVNLQAQAELEAAFSRYKTTQQASKVSYVDKMDNIPAFVSQQAEDDRTSARKLMSFLDQNPDRVKQDIGFDDLTVLPVGFKKKLSDESYVTLGILKVDFFNDHAEITAFIRLETPVNGSSTTSKSRALFFGVEKVRFTKQGGLSASSFKAVLLGDYLLPYEKWTVKLKGGLTKTETPADADPTRCYVEFECGGFKRANIAADIVVPRSVLLPCTPAGDVIANENTRVEIKDLRAYVEGGIRNIVFSSGNITPFAIADHPEYAFVVNTLIFDMSDTVTPAEVTFPVGYSGDTGNLWQGLYVREFSIILPEEFEDKATGQRVKISANEVVWDRSGFSGTISATGISPKVNMSKWTLSLNSFSIKFLQNSFKEGHFAGKIETPVHKEGSPDDKLFSYTANIFMGTVAGTSIPRSTYEVVVVTEKDLPFNFFWAKGSVFAGSRVELKLEQIAGKYKFRPSANLSGSLNIGASKSGNATGDYEENQTISFGKVTFYNLALQTVAPYVSIGGFAYEEGENNLLASFPVSITKFDKVTAPSENDIWTNIGFKINLIGKNKVTGESNIIFKSTYDPATGKLKPNGIALQKIAIYGSITPVTFNGYLEVVETAERKEIKGRMTVVVTKPKDDNAFEMGVAVLFGRDKTEKYNYGFVDGYFLSESLAIPVGPVSIYGLGLGVYWGMKPQFTSAGGIACSQIDANQLITYCPNKNINFGIKMMAAITNPAPEYNFRAKIYLDFAVNDDWSIDHIGIFGNGVISGVLSQVNKNDMRKTLAVIDKTPINSKNSDVATAKNNALLANRVANATNTNPSPAPPKVEGDGTISFSAGLLLDVTNGVFDLQAVAYLQSGDLVGAGQYNKLGELAIRFSSQENFIRIGSPDNRCGVRYGNTAELNAYFMLGDGVPQFPAPDEAILRIFPHLRERFNRPVCSDLKSGKALAIGAMAKFQAAGNFAIFFYDVAAVGGFDVLISNNSPCSPRGNWQGQGQIYALVQVKAGARICFFGCRKKTLINLSLAMYAYAQMPKPFGFEAAVAVRILGDMRKIHFIVGSTCSASENACGSN